MSKWNPDNSYLLEYKARIETGEILVGQDMWMELENLEEDFQDDRFQLLKDAAD